MHRTSALAVVPPAIAAPRLRHRWLNNSWPHLTSTMPPLPSTAQTLTNRLNSLSESNKAILQLIQRLAKLDFQPGTIPATSSNSANSAEGDVRLELSAEIHESLKQLEEELELLRQEVEDVVQGAASAAGRRRDSARESERLRLEVLLARLTEDLRSYVAHSTSHNNERRVYGFLILILTACAIVQERNTAKPN